MVEGIDRLSCSGNGVLTDGSINTPSAMRGKYYYDLPQCSQILNCGDVVCARVRKDKRKMKLGRRSRSEARRSDAVHDGPAWLQRHGCESVLGVTLEARGGGHANAKQGNERLYFDAWPRPGEGEYICDKYATCEAAI